MPKTTLPYGLWNSGIRPEMMAERPRLDDALFDTLTETLVWKETRAGQSLLFARQGEDSPFVISGSLKVGAGVGYGGGDFTAGAGMVIFVSGGRLYRVNLPDGQPRPITPAFGAAASPALSPDGSLVLFVHSYEGQDCLALVDTQGSAWPQKLISGADFYMQPAWHPSGEQIAWVEWNHPHMPWVSSRIQTADFRQGQASAPRLVCGDENTPIFQPCYSPDGIFLAFLAGDGEWDSLRLLHLPTGEEHSLVQNVSLLDPAWVQGMRLLAWQGSELYFLSQERGIRSLWRQNPQTGQPPQPVETSPFTWLSQISISPAGKISLLASSPQHPEQLICQSAQGWQTLARTERSPLNPEEISTPQDFTFLTAGGASAQAWYYPPTSSRYQGEGLPPLIVNVHGGPTASRNFSWNREALFWTSRGFAYAELNHRGSSGYGRSYLLALQGNWGEVDSEDAAALVEALGRQGLADASRAAVMGGSAGGFTALNCLIQFPGVFRAGVSSYGVANLFDVLIGTHKFEQHYNTWLVGELPQAAETYKQRSPVFQAGRIKDFLAIFQGDSDPVVPPQHAEQLVTRLKAAGVPHLYRVYAGEGHGWRKPETIADYYQTVLAFFKEHLVF